MSIVYLVVNTLNHYKIGISSKSIDERLAQLMTANSEHLNVVTTYNTEHARALEKMLHRYYGSKRIDREWFLLDKSDVKSFIDICKKLESKNILLKEQNPYFK
jgi:hypothetical protein